MDNGTRLLEDAVWAAAEGTATAEHLALIEADPEVSRRALEDLIDDYDERLEAVRALSTPERDQVVADFEESLGRLEAAYDLLLRSNGSAPLVAAADPTGEVRLQASWAAGKLVVWAAGPATAPADNDELATRLEAVGGPEVGWSLHNDLQLPTGGRAAALSIPIEQALGWLAAVAGGLGGDGVGSSVVWLARVSVLAVRLVARGAIVPTVHSGKRPDGKNLSLSVKWMPALVDEDAVAEFAGAMPAPVTVIAKADAKAVVLDVLGTVVDAIVKSVEFGDLPAPPPVTRTTSTVADAVMTRLDGSHFEAPIAVGAEVSKRINRWARPVTGLARTKLVVQLDPPDKGDAWYLAVLGRDAEDVLQPIEVAIASSKSTQPLADEMTRLERIYDVLKRPGGLRRGQVYLSQDEAWEFMTVVGPTLEGAGFEVRAPALSRRKPSGALRLFTEPTGDSVVGAHQLSNVRWSAVFDDVELTAAEILRLAAEARPLVKSRGRWVELDHVDLKEAAAALAERAAKKQMTGAEILRHAIGLEGSPLGSALDVQGGGWAAELLEKAKAVPAEAVATPPQFEGELRGYQSEALGWLGFLDGADLGGCLALDMGLGKTPTVLAQMARTADDGPTLVVAPPAVVGNWASEAARFAPDLRVVIHHGASRASADQLAGEVARADVVITTYSTAVRDVDALTKLSWNRMVLDEAQAIKNPANETAQQLRRIPARTKIALTGTPIENGLGDLWSILDFTNPGLVGTRPAFIAQMSGSGEGEAALRALNGILLFRRTKKEPVVAAELPDHIDELDHCTMTPEQIGLYQAVLDRLLVEQNDDTAEPRQGAILAAITALKQICNHPAAYEDDGRPLAGRSGKLSRLEEIVESVFAAEEKILIFTHFAQWGRRLADHLTEITGKPISCYDGSLARGARDKLVADFEATEGAGALVLSLKAGGTGLNLTAANHVVLYDRWWNPAVEDQARDRAWRIGQTKTVVSHRLVCPGTIDERVEEVVQGKRHIADVVLPKSSSLSDLNAEQLRTALGLKAETLLTEEDA